LNCTRIYQYWGMIKILRRGTQISIQDLGRFGMRRYGIPLGGVMDQQSAIYANTILQNPIDTPVLELYQPGHSLLFTKKCIICLTGALGDYKIDRTTIKSDKILELVPGSVLNIGRMTKGCRLYLALKGSLLVAKLLKSCSPLQGLHDTDLNVGSTINFQASFDKISPSARLKHPALDISEEVIVNKGPEYQLIEEHMRLHLLKSIYTISTQSNRMGYRMNGIKPKKKCHLSILSSAIMPGTVQLLPSGFPLVMMRDCATTGGYPRIFQLHENAINKMAQKGPGDVIKFKIVESGYLRKHK